MVERAISTAEAGVHVWDGEAWQPQGGAVSRVDIYYHPFAQTYRVVASSKDGFVMNCYLHAEVQRPRLAAVQYSQPQPHLRRRITTSRRHIFTHGKATMALPTAWHSVATRRFFNLHLTDTSPKPTRLTDPFPRRQAAAFAAEVEPLIREMDGPGDEDWIPPEASPQRHPNANPLFGATPTPPRRPREKALFDRSGYVGRRTTPERGSPSVLLSPMPREGAKDPPREPSPEPRGWEASTSHGASRLDRRPPAPPLGPPSQAPHDSGSHGEEQGANGCRPLPPRSPSRAWVADGAWGGDGPLVGEGRDNSGRWGHDRDTTDRCAHGRPRHPRLTATIVVSASRWERKYHEALRRKPAPGWSRKPLAAWEQQQQEEEEEDDGNRHKEGRALLTPVPLTRSEVRHRLEAPPQEEALWVGTGHRVSEDSHKEGDGRPEDREALVEQRLQETPRQT